MAEQVPYDPEEVSDDTKWLKYQRKTTLRERLHPLNVMKVWRTPLPYVTVYVCHECRGEFKTRSSVRLAFHAIKHTLIDGGTQ